MDQPAVLVVCGLCAEACPSVAGRVQYTAADHFLDRHRHLVLANPEIADTRVTVVAPEVYERMRRTA